MNDLAVRKKILLQESDINRQVLKLECDAIRYRMSHLHDQYERVHLGWKLALPVLGLFLAFRMRKAGGLLRSLSLLTLPRLFELWQRSRRLFNR